MRAPQYKFGSKWNLYQTKLEKYFEQKQVEKSRKSAILISSICPKTYEILKKLCYPTTPGKMKYEHLCNKLGAELLFNASVYGNRIKFYDLKQLKNESVHQWFIRIQDSATSCNFGKFLEEKIKEKFVTGLSKGPILNRFLKENPNKTVSMLLEIALEEELKSNTAIPLKCNCSKMNNSTHKITENSLFQNSTTTLGGESSGCNTSPFNEFKCSTCGVIGQLCMCRFNDTKNQSQIPFERLSQKSCNGKCSMSMIEKLIKIDEDKKSKRFEPY